MLSSDLVRADPSIINAQLRFGPRKHQASLMLKEHYSKGNNANSDASSIILTEIMLIMMQVALF